MATFFEHTRTNVERAALELGMSSNVLTRLQKPEHILSFDLPTPLEDGSTKIFKAWRVQHNNARGPYKGGIRYHPESNLDEVEALASIMTWKTSLAGIPFGGAKGAITIDPKSLSRKDLESVSRSYVRRIVDSIGPKKDIPAPDVGTTSEIMAWMTDEYAKLIGHFEPAAFTGKPVEIGGSSGREKATGFGGAVVLREYARIINHKSRIKHLRIAVQGVGNVGGVIAEELMNAGHRIVAISDSKGGIFLEKGIDVHEVLGEKEKAKKPLIEIAKNKKHISNDELLEADVDILIPAALEGVIHEANAERIKAKVILEMANGPVTPEADAILAKMGVEIIPDILANSGGVVGSYFEWVQSLNRMYWEEAEVLAKIEKIMVGALQASFEEKSKRGGTLREASYRIAVGRVVEAMRLRGWV